MVNIPVRSASNPPPRTGLTRDVAQYFTDPGQIRVRAISDNEEVDVVDGRVQIRTRRDAGRYTGAARAQAAQRSSRVARQFEQAAFSSPSPITALACLPAAGSCSSGPILGSWCWGSPKSGKVG